MRLPPSLLPSLGEDIRWPLHAQGKDTGSTTQSEAIDPQGKRIRAPLHAQGRAEGRGSWKGGRQGKSPFKVGGARAKAQLTFL
jgi:hypothetical protein